MGWFLRVKKGMSWKEQTLDSLSAPPPPLMAFSAVLLMLVYFATHSDYKEKVEQRKTGFRFSLLLLPLLLIVALNLVMLRHRLLRYNFGAPRPLYHTAVADEGGSASGLLLVLLLLLVLERETMNRREAGEGFQMPRRISNCFKDRDEELSFFRDLKKREKDQFASLLQPISDEFEANRSFGLSRMNSGGRKGEFLGETGKNDYNWLKTPPATPLFPSLEMETNDAQELMVQKEIPIIQPLSRFAGNSESNKTTPNNIPTSPIPKPKLPQRQKAPTGRPTIPLIDQRNMKTAPLVIQKPNMTLPEKAKPVFTPIVKSTVTRGSRSNFPISNTLKSTRVEPNSSAKSSISGASNETPPNLRTTNRPSSATRGRPAYQDLSAPQKQYTNTNTNTKIKKQSCSPSVTRGRKSDGDGNAANQNGASRVGNGVQIIGSRMVDKFMNARMSNADERRSKIKLNGSMNESSRSCNGEERQPKIKLNGSLNESSGFGRLMSKNSLDMALKHMDIQRDSSNGRKTGMIPGRKS